MERISPLQAAEKIGWDVVVEGTAPFQVLGLRELWRYRDLILLFVRRDVVTVYRQTILGPLWFVIQPLFNMLVFTFLFGRVAGLDTGGAPPMLFYLAGIVSWTFFSTNLTATANTFIHNSGLFGKVYFPRMVSPVATLLANAAKLSVQFALFLALWIWYVAHGQVGFSWSGLPVLSAGTLFVWILLALLSLGFGILASSLTTKYRDVIFLVQFGVQLWMYVSPVVYSMGNTHIPERLRSLLLLNPLVGPIEMLRDLYMGAGAWTWGMLAYSVGFAGVLLLFSGWLFHRVERTSMDTV